MRTMDRGAGPLGGGDFLMFRAANQTDAENIAVNAKKPTAGSHLIFPSSPRL